MDALVIELDVAWGEMHSYSHVDNFAHLHGAFTMAG